MGQKLYKLAIPQLLVKGTCLLRMTVRRETQVGWNRCYLSWFLEGNLTVKSGTFVDSHVNDNT